MKKLLNLSRIRDRDELPLAVPRGAEVAELGVAEGEFSARLLQHRGVRIVYSVDAWDDAKRRHDDEEFFRARQRLARFGKRSKIIRMRFDEAANLFNDGSLDLVYVDGYAHTGQEGGQTLRDWWPKVKRGGILAGHDYDAEKWPQTVKHVDRFVAAHKLELHVIPRGRTKHPSWCVRKGTQS